jgi:hypothetical protein
LFLLQLTDPLLEDLVLNPDSHNLLILGHDSCTLLGIFLTRILQLLQFGLKLSDSMFLCPFREFL